MEIFREAMPVGSDSNAHLMSDISTELNRIRASSSSKILRPYFQRVETWELLLIVYALEGDGAYGIEDYLDRLQTLKLTRVTMRNFIKDRVAEKSFLTVTGDKKSRKSLILSDELRSDLENYFKLLDDLNLLRGQGADIESGSLVALRGQFSEG